jgi:hypothetical protein
MSCGSCGERLQKGDVYVCKECGLEVTITGECDCESCDLMCCGKPLTKKQ